MTSPPSPKHNPITAACARVAGSLRFEGITLTVILANAVVLGMETYDRLVDRYGDLFDFLNFAFLAYFVVEISIRLAAHGSRPQNFFRNGWNAFDFIVIAAAFMPGVRENATLLRVVRLLRVFRIVSVLPEMQILIRGLVRSFAPLGSMAVLTLLLFYVYAMLGWILFADHDPERWDTIGQSLLTLFSVLTLEEWTVIQRTALELSGWAWVYFVSFVIVSSFVLINMVIAVVISSVEDARAIVAEEERQRQREELRQEDRQHAELMDQLDSMRKGIDAIEEELARQRSELGRLASAGSSAGT